MARLVLTHALPRGRLLAIGLRQQGHECVLLAFSELKPCQHAARRLAAVMLHDNEVVVCVSPSSAMFAAQAHPGPWPVSTRFFAVGSATAAALVRFGLAVSREQIETPDDGDQDAASLLRASALQLGRGRRLLMLCGIDARQDGFQTLRQRGFELESFELFKRASVEPAAAGFEQLQRWAASGLPAAFLVTASDAAQRLDTSLQARGLSQWAHAQPSWAPHARIAQRLRLLGWTLARSVERGQLLEHAAIESL